MDTRCPRTSPEALFPLARLVRQSSTSPTFQGFRGFYNRTYGCAVCSGVLPNASAPMPSEIVERIPVICSITPTIENTGVPKSIVYPMKRSLSVLIEESTTLLKSRDGQWLRGGTVSLCHIRHFDTSHANNLSLFKLPDIPPPPLRNPSVHVHTNQPLPRLFVQHLQSMCCPLH